MSVSFPELDQVRVTVDERTREQHLAEIGAALRTRHNPARRRFRFLAIATALALLLPVVALAAEDAVPGDVLYPVKRLVEPLVAVFDRDAELDNRVSEAEMLIDRGAEPGVVQQQIDEARTLITDEHGEHSDRLDRVEHDLELSGREDTSEGVEMAPDDPPVTEDTRADETDGSADSARTTIVEESTDSASGESTTTTVTDGTTAPTDPARDG